MTGGEPSPELAVRDAYYTGFVGVLIACFTPSKTLGYMLPALFLVWLALRVPVLLDRNRALALICAIGAGAVAYEFVAPEFLVTNYLLAVVTYSAVIPLLLVRSGPLGSRELLERMLVATQRMLLVQGVYGILQATYGALQTGGFGGDNGDYVEGTMHPSLDPERAFSNPMFAVNLALMTVVCLALPQTAERRRVGLYVGILALILAAVVHVLVFLLTAVVLALVLRRGGERRATTEPTGSTRRIVVIAALVLGLTYVVLPGEIDRVASYAETALDLDALEVPRAILLYRTVDELPQDAPLQPVLGLGPGQFSSRASLIASGLYLGGPDAPKTVPLLVPQATRLATDYCLSLLVMMADAPENSIGSSQQPFFSFLSIYTETGIIGLIAVLWLVARLLRRVQLRARDVPARRLEVLLFSVGVIFIVLIGLQENYWEAPQAVLVGLLVLKVLYANIMAPAPELQKYR